MKHASILLLALGLCGLSFAACAEGDDTAFGNKPGDGGEGGEGGSTASGKGGAGGKPTSSSSSSASSSTGNSSGDVCMIECSSDDVCASGCKTPTVGTNCCDVGTKTCYISGENVCPTQGASSGSMY